VRITRRGEKGKLKLRNHKKIIEMKGRVISGYKKKVTQLIKTRRKN